MNPWHHPQLRQRQREKGRQRDGQRIDRKERQAERQKERKIINSTVTQLKYILGTQSTIRMYC